MWSISSLLEHVLALRTYRPFSIIENGFPNTVGPEVKAIAPHRFSIAVIVCNL